MDKHNTKQYQGCGVKLEKMGREVIIEICKKQPTIIKNEHLVLIQIRFSMTTKCEK